MTKLSIRPLMAVDISLIVNYWFGKSDDELMQMGVDKQKLSSRENFQESLKDSLAAALDKTKSFYMIWLIDGKAIGYSSLKDIEQGEIATMHLHVWDSEHRGKGYGATLFSISAIEFYKIFKLKLILCEPKASNPTPNKMLTKIGFKQWRSFVGKPSDLALLSEFNSYIVDVKIAENFVKGELK